ncbi:MAG TPA: hypothetical protein VFF52_15020 [Isosphaeraceae bacterium]|nr:hypothetical protein [Isosphaeraceae bacterium]
MRRSTIAVCLLLSPVPVFACFDHPPGVTAGWIEERPRSAWDLARGTAEETRWEELLGMASLAAGSGVLLLAVALRAARRGRMHPLEPAAPRPLGLPFDRPTGLPVRVDSGHERPGPIRIIREEANEPCPVAVAVTGR